MGRHGHVQVRHAEYGDVCFADWGQNAAAEWLEEQGINICTNEDCGVRYADSWEIEIPDKKTGHGQDYEKIQMVIDALREHPDSLDEHLPSDCQGEKYGEELAEELADLLEEGLKSAKEHEYSWINIDWY